LDAVLTAISGNSN